MDNKWTTNGQQVDNAETRHNSLEGLEGKWPLDIGENSTDKKESEAYRLLTIISRALGLHMRNKFITS